MTEPSTPVSATVSPLRRVLAMAFGLRTLRPVPATEQEPYGECDGQ